MNHIWGHKGPYFHAPCQRDRFPSLVDEIGEDGDKLVAHLGISNMSDMGARLKRGRKHSNVAEQLAADNLKDACVPLNKMFHSSSQGLRRGVDKYAQMPKFDRYVDEQEQQDLVQRHRKLWIVPIRCRRFVKRASRRIPVNVSTVNAVAAMMWPMTFRGDCICEKPILLNKCLTWDWMVINR
ncbi:uncharacterized protein LOC117780797 [Drosophila innubila]|uniref:uncharacterized protein LOC117780797 n=1 Tax=Drosophila innubila TaxID=198719 RepID=UPI00148E8F06|nr:uncharacterized protein LOC117780797 [Drosophila innubila]